MKKIDNQADQTYPEIKQQIYYIPIYRMLKIKRFYEFILRSIKLNHKTYK